jgi:hypothetical protein
MLENMYVLFMWINNMLIWEVSLKNAPRPPSSYINDSHLQTELEKYLPNEPRLRKNLRELIKWKGSLSRWKHVDKGSLHLRKLEWEEVFHIWKHCKQILLLMDKY